MSYHPMRSTLKPRDRGGVLGSARGFLDLPPKGRAPHWSRVQILFVRSPLHISMCFRKPSIGWGVSPMIEAPERERLRQRALFAWDDAKRLHETALGFDSSEKKRGAPVHRSANVMARHLRARGELEVLVDRAIRGAKATHAAREADSKGIALVASMELSALLRLEELVTSHLGYVVGATDAGTAFGLAIATQPDIAVVDGSLDLGRGADLVFSLPLYAPCTRSLLLTADANLMAKARIVGVDVLPHEHSPGALLSWVATSLRGLKSQEGERHDISGSSFARLTARRGSLSGH